MNETEIKWTELTWNPASGCHKISPGCAYCYAHTLAENKRGTPAFPKGFDIVEKPHKLDEPRRVKRPSLIFTNSMTDCFLDDISDSYRDRIFAACRVADWHRYQVLTKRPRRAVEYFTTRKAPSCVWLGVTVERQDYAWRIDELRKIDAAVRFISIEPLLGPIDNLNLDGIHWVIVGGESGSHLTSDAVRGLVRRGNRASGEALWVPRDDRANWVRSIRDQCERAGVAFFFKQWGGPRPESGGRMLDGHTHDGLPVDVQGAMPGGQFQFRSHAGGLASVLPSNTRAV